MFLGPSPFKYLLTQESKQENALKLSECSFSSVMSFHIATIKIHEKAGSNSFLWRENLREVDASDIELIS